MPKTTPAALTPPQKAVLLVIAAASWTAVGLSLSLQPPGTTLWGSIGNTFHAFSYCANLALAVTTTLRVAAPRWWQQARNAWPSVLRRSAEIAVLIAGAVYWPLVFKGFDGTALDTTRSVLAHAVPQLGVLAYATVGGLADVLTRRQRWAAVGVLMVYPVVQVGLQLAVPGHPAPYNFLNIHGNLTLVSGALTGITVIGLGLGAMLNRCTSPLTQRLSSAISSLPQPLRGGSQEHGLPPDQPVSPTVQVSLGPSETPVQAVVSAANIPLDPLSGAVSITPPSSHLALNLGFQHALAEAASQLIHSRAATAAAAASRKRQPGKAVNR